MESSRVRGPWTRIGTTAIDELRLMTFPVVLGSGKRLFGARAEPLKLALDDVQRYDSGVVTLTYRK
jgi:dihydrofolate reductase